MPTVNQYQPSATKHKVSVEIDGVDANIYSAVARVDVSLRQHEHDYARIVLAGIPAGSVTDYVDRPVMVRIEVPYGEGFTFTDGRVEGGLLQEATLTCLGVSSAMRG